MYVLYTDGRFEYVPEEQYKLILQLITHYQMDIYEITIVHKILQI